MTAAQVRHAVIGHYEEEHPWDERVSERSLADVDERTLESYVERGRACGRIAFGYTGARDTLSRLDALDGERLINAAAVCFCPSREVMLKMGMFEGSDRTEILDVHQESGTIFDLAGRAELYIFNNIRRGVVIGGSLERDEVPEIPRAAFREAILNALCHRDYTDSSCVQIDIFWNAVEIFSPGRFPEGHEPEGYLSGKDSRSSSRNRRIADMLFRSKEIESYGTGLQRIKLACEGAGVPFSYRQTGFGVYVRFDRVDPYNRRQPPPTAANRRQPPPTADGSGQEALPRSERAVYEFLVERGPAGTAALSDGLGIPRRTLRDVLRRLADSGLVVASGADKNRVYSPRG